MPRVRCRRRNPSPLGNEREHVLTFGERRYRVRGLEKNLGLQTLKINLLIAHTSSGLVHVDTFDLYSARQRSASINQVATELHLQEDTIKADLGRVLLQMETLQEEALRPALAPILGGPCRWFNAGESSTGRWHLPQPLPPRGHSEPQRTYAFAQDQMRAYREQQGFSRREARAATSQDLGHGDGRGRYVASVYARDE